MARAIPGPGFGVTVAFEQAGKQKTSVFLEYLPVGIRDEAVKATLAPYSDDQDITIFKSPRLRADERTVRMRINQTEHLPHYITFKMEVKGGKIISKTASVRVRGRRQKCFYCGSIKHFSTRCRHRVGHKPPPKPLMTECPWFSSRRGNRRPQSFWSTCLSK